MSDSTNEITQILSRWSNGDNEALDQLIPLIYPELRRIARSHMHREKPGNTLQTSALINEAYIRLTGVRSVDWRDRDHFFAASSQIMRRILIDHARRYRYKKRGGGVADLELNDELLTQRKRSADLIALDDALEALGKFDKRKAKIVELRFFGGMTVEETASILGVSPITVNREWRVARAWLLGEINERK